jgi:hypothetical protein
MKIVLCAGKNGRAILIGDVSRAPTPGKPVTLKNARMVIYWSEACGGLLGLAANGPQDGTRITAKVPRTCETAWQEWTEVTAKAAKAIDKWPAY